MEQRVKMADGTHLFVEVLNPNATGIPLVLCDGLGCDGYIWKYFKAHFQDKNPIIHFHYRGHGRSDFPKRRETLTIEQTGKDLARIIAKLEIPKAVFIGHSMGVQIIFETFKRIPECFVGTALICAGFEKPMHTWHAPFERGETPGALNFVMRNYYQALYNGMTKYGRLINPVWKRMMASDLSLASTMIFEVNRFRIKQQDFEPYFKHLYSLRPEVFGHFALSYAKHSARKILPKFQIPTLVIGGGKDTFAPAWVIEDMDSLLPNSELHIIPDATHVAPIEHPELINQRVETWLHSAITPGITNFRLLTESSHAKRLSSSQEFHHQALSAL